MRQIIWQQYVWGRQTVPQLAQRFGRSEKWIRTQLQRADVNCPVIPPQPVVVVADTTFDRRTFGVCVLRAPHLKKNLLWRVTERETRALYAECLQTLKERGFAIQAMVVDGRPFFFEIFQDFPVQMCHFHQIAIVTRYLTTRPQLAAGQQLRALAFTLKNTTEAVFARGLQEWHDRWELFLKERTVVPGTKRWFYTHRRLRSAYRSLKVHLPYLFTHQRFPDLHIPNTTNSLDGTFSHVKTLLRIHRGLTRATKEKLIKEILSK